MYIHSWFRIKEIHNFKKNNISTLLEFTINKVFIYKPIFIRKLSQPIIYLRKNAWKYNTEVKLKIYFCLY